jgi:hypothetical protein
VSFALPPPSSCPDRDVGSGAGSGPCRVSQSRGKPRPELFNRKERTRCRFFADAAYAAADDGKNTGAPLEKGFRYVMPAPAYSFAALELDGKKAGRR